MRSPRDVRKGDPITAKLFMDLWDFIQSCRIGHTVGSGTIVHRGRGGQTVSSDSGGGGEFVIKLTSRSGNNHAWVLQGWDDTTGWYDKAKTGTVSVDQAKEINGAITQPLPLRVRAWREGRQIFFQADEC